jgi:amidase
LSAWPAKEVAADMSELVLATAAEQLEAMAKGEVSSEELTEAYLERIRRYDKEINAVVSVESEAHAQARRRDQARAESAEIGPLHGVPITVKDSFEVAGLRSTAGIPALADHVPTADADAVARLRDAGAVIVGKTNIPTANADYQTSNPVHGVTSNPWDLERTPGGSAGGGAAAVAAGLSALDFGSEIGGSLRITAHFTGIYGHKSSYGTIPLLGHVPPGPQAPRRFGIDTDLVVAGAQARGLDDLELVLRAVAGPAMPEARAWRLGFPPTRAQELSEFRVAAWLSDPFVPIDNEVRAVLSEALERLEEAGARVDREPSLPVTLEESHSVYEPLLYGAFAEDRSTFSAKATLATSRTMMRRRRPWQVMRFLRQSHRAWLCDHGRHFEIRRKWADFFANYDVVVMPVSPTVAVPHHNKDHDRFGRSYRVNGQRRDYDEQPVWNGVANLAGTPSTVVPAGLAASGLPVGIQIMGPHFEDLTSLEFARRVDEVLCAYRRPPGYEIAGAAEPALA